MCAGTLSGPLVWLEPPGRKNLRAIISMCRLPYNGTASQCGLWAAPKYVFPFALLRFVQPGFFMSVSPRCRGPPSPI